jgi:hypothetical protein
MQFMYKNVIDATLLHIILLHILFVKFIIFLS